MHTEGGTLVCSGTHPEALSWPTANPELHENLSLSPSQPPCLPPSTWCKYNSCSWLLGFDKRLAPSLPSCLAYRQSPFSQVSWQTKSDGVSTIL